jgi:hypothetical protein
MGKFMKVVLFTAALALVNILFFARPFIHLDMSGGSAFSRVLGFTVIVLSVLLFFIVNYRILTARRPRRKAALSAADAAYETLNGCVQAINTYLRTESKVFAQQLNSIINQLRRMQKKQETMDNVLRQKFQPAEMSYTKFKGAADGAEKLMRLGVRSVLNRLKAFDEDEYARSVRSPYQNPINEERRGLFEEYAGFIKKTIDTNEDILIKTDRLILELTKLSDASDIDNLNALKEIDTLIQNTQFYK